MVFAMRSALVAVALFSVSAEQTAPCCWSKYGDASSCGNYPEGGSGGICGGDGVTPCQSNSDCANLPPPAPPSPPPAPTPPAPTPPPTPTPPAPTPPPTPVPPPSPMPDKIVGHYLLIADDDWPYTSETDWKPQLSPYMGDANVLWLAFVHPAKMDALPPGMIHIGQNREGVAPGTKIIPSIGGQSYSANPSPWPWLTSVDAAEAMAATVAKWRDLGMDGIDMDIEDGAGGKTEAGPNAVAFMKKLKELWPGVIITQPVYGYPQVPAENDIVNECFKGGDDGTLQGVGIMVYNDLAALDAVHNYVSPGQGGAINSPVPSGKMIVGIGGNSGADIIKQMAQAVHDQDLGGMMTWFGSVVDPATGKPGNRYSGGYQDASTQSADTQAAWRDALTIMGGTPPGPVPTPTPTPPAPTPPAPTPPAPTPTPPAPTPPAPTPPAPTPPAPTPPAPPAPPGPPGTCCWSAWGTECADYPSSGNGGLCNSDWTTSCNSDSDCPAKPAPAPPPPTPPGPPAPPAGPPYMGFWYGYAGSTSDQPAPPSGWFFSFPGLTVRPPFDPVDYGTILPPPSWGQYDKLILTQGGGDTSWGDSLYAELQAQIPEYKKAGWDGVCWDWEKASQDHTSDGFNSLMKAAKDAGLVNILTSTAEGPYIWSAPNTDATDIDWSNIDFFVPQIYAADGKLSDPDWPSYAEYWVNGAGVPNIHGVTFAAIPMEKILWGMPVGTCDQASGPYGGSGCVEWAYSPGVKPPGAVVV